MLRHVEAHPADISRMTAAYFQISRQLVARYLRRLVDEGQLEATGNTKDRRYRLKWFVDETFVVPVNPQLAEDVVWRTKVLALLDGVPTNVVSMCQFGFTEIFNNAIEHAQSQIIITGVRRNANLIEIRLTDMGVGIFNKIQQALTLSDPRHALLELAKGKLTTDPGGHTGEGIFFTSRMFDEFAILSGDLFFGATTGDENWLVEVENREPRQGTMVSMEISTHSRRTTQEVFDKYAAPAAEYSFSRTHVPVKLARYGEEQLVSRSQARRVLARFEKFQEVLLDFSGVETIGPAFADEIFRVYRQAHPEIKVLGIHMKPQIEEMVYKARRGLNESATTQISRTDNN